MTLGSSLIDIQCQISQGADWVGKSWDAIVKTLLLPPRGNSIAALVEWAQVQQSNAALTEAIFTIHPKLAFEDDRLGDVLLIGSNQEFRSMLFRYFIDNHEVMPKIISCVEYASDNIDFSIKSEPVDGTMLQQFLLLGSTPFLGDMELSDSFIGTLERGEVSRFVDLLGDAYSQTGRSSSYHPLSLINLLSAPIMWEREAYIVQAAVEFWGKAELTGKIQEGTALQNVSSTLKGVITKSSSFNLYNHIIKCHEDVRSKFPTHLELMINRDIKTRGVERLDNNPECPTFTLGRAIGRSITSKKTQSWIFDWIDEVTHKTSGLDLDDDWILFNAVSPLLEIHIEALAAKESDFNPSRFDQNSIFAEISDGKYFKVACKATVSAGYRSKLMEIPLSVIAEKEHDFEAVFSGMFSGVYKHCADTKVRAALYESVHKPHEFSFLANLFRDRLESTSSVFLFTGNPDPELVNNMLRLLDENQIKVDAKLVLGKGGITPVVSDALMSRDLGL